MVGGEEHASACAWILFLFLKCENVGAAGSSTLLFTLPSFLSNRGRSNQPSKISWMRPLVAYSRISVADVCS